VLANQSAVDGAGQVLWASLLADGLRPQFLLGPEHGLWGVEQDMVPVEGGRDPLSGLPVHSLYGHAVASLDPDPALLEGLDLVVFDIQDIGSRYYTFQATLQRLLRVCAQARVAVLVLDRPNPLGRQLEGRSLDLAFSSFVGQAPLPNRHGLTMGELARLFLALESLDCELTVAPCPGWQGGDQRAEPLTWPWVPPSPNMPDFETALVYPGACLLEATNLSEGRGTTTPFSLLGAPWLDRPDEVAGLLTPEAPGLTLTPAWFRPGFQKHAGQLCQGLRLAVQDSSRVRSYPLFLRLLALVKARCPDFQWRRETYEFVDLVPAIDLLVGDSEFRRLVDAGAPLEEYLARQAGDDQAFLNLSEPALLYPRTSPCQP
jgi:uncharacterized protein YbbC (DUF1343 family)